VRRRDDGAGQRRRRRRTDASRLDAVKAQRVHGSVDPGPNSHFFTISEAERDKLIAMAAETPDELPRWNYEGIGMWAGDVTPVGACSLAAGAAGYTVPIYRLYNNGFGRAADSNHRYTGSPTVAGDMVAQGWLLEGVVFCAMRYN
jgi:hypothetical protein